MIGCLLAGSVAVSAIELGPNDSDRLRSTLGAFKSIECFSTENFKSEGTNPSFTIGFSKSDEEGESFGPAKINGTLFSKSVLSIKETYLVSPLGIGLHAQLNSDKYRGGYVFFNVRYMMQDKEGALPCDKTTAFEWFPDGTVREDTFSCCLSHRKVAP